jgi:hypothetical protein
MMTTEQIFDLQKRAQQQEPSSSISIAAGVLDDLCTLALSAIEADHRFVETSLTLREVAELTGRSINFWRTKLHKGQLAGYLKTGTQYIVPAAAVYPHLGTEDAMAFREAVRARVEDRNKS